MENVSGFRKFPFVFSNIWKNVSTEISLSLATEFINELFEIEIIF